MGEKRRLMVGDAESGMRADKYIADRIEGLSREKIKDVFVQGDVLLNGNAAKPSVRVKSGDCLELELPDVKMLSVEAQNIPLSIVYEDRDVAVIDKPQGMVVHPAPGNYDGTMVNALLYHMKDLSTINGVIRPGIVHRIDKDTSGLLVVAKNNTAHIALAEQFAAHTITRAYTAVAHGVFRNDSGTIDAPIGRDPANRKAMTVILTNSKRAVTHYRVCARYDTYTHVDLHLETGRTHQIRVHLKMIGHPIIGDPLYGRDTALDKKFAGQLLHAYRLGFLHPRTGHYLEFNSELPPYFYELLHQEKQ
jgi:23S rRNA pseudouridine1911/1915/1917 synthase